MSRQTVAEPRRVLQFDEFLRKRPAPSGIDVQCKLGHFAILTYALDPERLAGLIPPPFVLDTVEIDGREQALLSVVPFVDIDFTSAVVPFPTFTMGQTNYRIYIVDTRTGEHCAWFLGTTLDSWTCFVPHYLWKLPWYPGRVRFECEFDASTGLYPKYSMRTQSDWAPAAVDLAQPNDADAQLPGFPDLETGLVILTHPMSGYYHRRDGKLGSYHIWHDRLRLKPAELIRANFGLLSRMNLVTEP